jgi:hypothetical protein
MTQDWRVYRPAIWLAMLGIAVALLVNPWWLGAPLLGAAIGVALRIRSGRRPRARGGGRGGGGGSTPKPRRR